MARKAKKKVHPMPPLGWKDTLLYWTGLAFTGGGTIFSIFYPIFRRQELAFAEDTVVAYTSGQGSLMGSWQILWLLTMFALLCVHYQRRMPVFGDEKVKYGPPAYPRKYPLLMKNKPRHWESTSVTAKRKKTAAIAGTVISLTGIFSFVTYPLSLSGRNQLHYDGSISIVDMHNRETVRYKMEDIQSVELDTCTEGSKPSKWSIQMVLTTVDRAEYRFGSGTFRGDWVPGMKTIAGLKEIYGSRVIVGDTSKLERVVWEQHLNSEETAILYDLFEASEGR